MVLRDPYSPTIINIPVHTICFQKEVYKNLIKILLCFVDVHEGNSQFCRNFIGKTLSCTLILSKRENTNYLPATQKKCCLGGRHRAGTKAFECDIATNARKIIIGILAICNRK